MTANTEPVLQVFPLPRHCPYEPPEQYAEFRAEKPATKVCLANGKVVWLVTSHELFRKLAIDPRISSNPDSPGYPILVDGKFDRRGALNWFDPPEHTLYRRLVANEFTPRRIRSIRPAVERVVDEHLSQMLSAPRPVDLVQALAKPVSVQTICDLLGVPFEDHAMFEERAGVIVDRTSSAADWERALLDLREYFARLIASASLGDGDGILSRLVVKFKEADLDMEHLIGMAHTLLVAGFETTANQIGLSVVILLENPERLAELQEFPDRVPSAVGELLRYASPADHVAQRVAIDDIEIDGVRIEKGSGVILSGGAANRDGEIYADPDTLDFGRDAPGHVAFGHGAHLCLGRYVAELELDVVLRALLARVPGLRLAVPLSELPFATQTLLYGFSSVPVTW
jgi:cytochrome P450